uniref:Uncharacterized protein n=1 Tax=Arundo donax TaxID=35708 RepID=A0A0A8YFQ4_ARUDO
MRVALLSSPESTSCSESRRALHCCLVVIVCRFSTTPRKFSSADLDTIRSRIISCTL